MTEIMKGSLFHSLDKREQEEIIEAAQKKSPDPTDQMFLTEIRDRDTDNLLLVLHGKLYDHRFDTLRQAIAFMGQCQAMALTKFGISGLEMVKASVRQNGKGFRPGAHDFVAKRIEVEMRKKSIKCELRPPAMYLKNRPEDVWKSGIYFYKDNEIAFFISNPMEVKYNRNGIYVPGKTEYLVRTNVPSPGKGES